MLDKLEEAKLEKGASMFRDVTTAHWALPYINFVAKNNLIVGYPDGTYHADESISYAQVLTVVLRVLGYEAEVQNGFWPDNYISKAAGLELTKDMVFDPYAAISRADAFVILARALDTKVSGTQTDMITGFGYSIIEDAIVLATHTTDASLAVDEVRTDLGIYKYSNVSFDHAVGSKAKLYLDADKEIVMALESADYTKILVIKKHLSADTYLCTVGAQEIEYTFSNTMNLYTKDAKSSYMQLQGVFVPGAVITLHGAQENVYDYALFSEAEDIVPVVASKDYQSGDTMVAGIDVTEAEDLVIYRDGYAAKLEDIRKNDVIYYNPVIHTMEIYIDKVTGLYEEALPNKANVTQVVVGGRTFNIGSAAATRQLDETAGSYKINDVVTLLLGKDNAVVGVSNAQTDVSLDYGVLVQAGRYITDKITDTGTTKYQVQLMMSDGNIYTYDADKDYSDEKGSLVKLRFVDGIVSLNEVTARSFEGQVSQEKQMVGTTGFADNAVIFDLTSNDDGVSAAVSVLDFEDLESIYIHKKDVIAYIDDGAFDEVTVVLLDNVSNVNVKYGVVTKIQTQKRGTGDNQSVTRTYTVLVDGIEQNVVRNGYFVDVQTGKPVMVMYDGNVIDMLQPLTQASVGIKIQAMDYQRIKVNNIIYDLSDELLIYYSPKANEYLTLSRTELENAKVEKVWLYKDYTGLVRAIRVEI